MSVPTNRNLEIKQVRLPFRSETTKSTLKEPQHPAIWNKQHSVQPGGLIHHETNTSLVCGNDDTRKWSSGAIRDLHHMTNQLCSYSSRSAFRLIALGARLHIFSFRLSLLPAGQGVENYCASISFLVNGDNWRILWGPEEHIGGCHTDHYPTPSSNSGLESGIPCPSVTRRMCAELCVSGPLDSFTALHPSCYLEVFLMSISCPEPNRVQALPRSSWVSESAWNGQDQCWEPFRNWLHFHRIQCCWILSVALLPVPVICRQ